MNRTDDTDKTAKDWRHSTFNQSSLIVAFNLFHYFALIAASDSSRIGLIRGTRRVIRAIRGSRMRGERLRLSGVPDARRGTCQIG
jgi:hypothetical protein